MDGSNLMKKTDAFTTGPGEALDESAEYHPLYNNLEMTPDANAYIHDANSSMSGVFAYILTRRGSTELLRPFYDTDRGKFSFNVKSHAISGGSHTFSLDCLDLENCVWRRALAVTKSVEKPLFLPYGQVIHVSGAASRNTVNQAVSDTRKYWSR